MRLSRFIAVAALVAFANGCVIRETTTTVRIVEPAHVGVATGANGSDVVPPGDAPVEALLDRGVLSTGEQTTAAYALFAQRNADKSLALRWDTRLALSAGEGLSLLSPSGELHFFGDLDRPLATTTGDNARLPLCAELTAVITRNGRVAYDSTLVPRERCALGPRDVAVPVTLRVPAREIEIRRKSEPDRGLAAALVVLDAVIVLPIALPLHFAGKSAQKDAAKNPGLRSESNTLLTISDVILITGGALALLAVPTFFASSKDEIVAPTPE